MIYFLQDTSALHIKIGYTGGSAGERMRALQTGCPVGLVLLATIEGEKSDERELHERFALARVHGEWFRPVPELIQTIILLREDEGAKRGRAEATPPLRGARRPGAWPLHIYLAGKIAHDCWRHNIVDGLRLFGTDPSSSDDDAVSFLQDWPVLHGAIFDTHHYVGPFFLSGEHGVDLDREGDHGGGLNSLPGKYSGSHRPRNDVVRLCLDAIRKADLVFAWIDQLDCYGTVAELGYAKALGKPVVVDGPRPFRDMWFLHEMAFTTGFDHESPEAALKSCLNWIREGAVDLSS